MWKLRCAFCWVLCGCFHTVAGSQIRLTIKDALLKSGVESKPPRQLGRDQAQAAYNSLADELAAEAKQGGMEEGGGGGILMDSVQVHTERLSGAPCTGSKCRKLEYVFKVKKLLPTAEALERLEQMHGVQLVGARVEAVDPLEGIHTSGTTAGRMQGSVVSFEENRGLYRVAWDTGAQDLMRREQLFLHALQAPVSEGDLQGMALAQAFFQFLALPEEALWVNLSPNQSDKIMHPDLSVTRAGDVLLRADYHLKNSTAFLLHPDDPTGKQFWDLLALPFPTPELCLPFRTWIHPVSSGVRVVEQGDHLFVVSAGLTVSAESSDLLQRAAATAPQDSCVAANEATQQRAESLFRQLVIPQLLQKIRLDSSLFEELQKVFYWRVIAQWYKQQSPAYLDDIGLDPDSLARSSWETFSQIVASERMRAVFDKYTNDVANGAYNDEKIYRVQPSGKLFARTYSHGAIDFSGKLEVF